MKRNKKSGFSLIEIMLAILILAFLAVGGAAVLYQTGAGILVQGNKRVALELANQRAEIALSQYYYDIVPSEYNVEGTYYLTATSSEPGVLELNDSVESESINFNGRTYTVYTEVVRWSAGEPDDRPDFEPEHVEVRVTVEYGTDSDDAVTSITVIIPPEVTL